MFRSVGWRAVLPLLGLAGWLLLPCAPASAQVRMGVNDTNLYTLDPPEAHATLDQMAQAGVKMLRMSMRDKDGNLPSLVRYANDRGIQVMIVIPLGAVEFYGPEVQTRAGSGPYRAMRPMSQLDLGLFAQAWSAHRAAMRAAGAKVAVYEIGNEVNGPDFNGDYAVDTDQTNVPLRDCNGDGNCAAVAAGMGRLVGALRIVRQSGKLDGALLIAPGITDTNQVWMRRAHGSGTPMGPTLAYLNAIGAGQYVDGYSFHHYLRDSGPNSSPDALEVAIHQCADAGGKPCWLTEWGVRTQSADCGDDPDQQQVIAQAAAALRAEPPSVLAGAIYFDWHSKPALSLVRCGRLTTSEPFRQ